MMTKKISGILQSVLFSWIVLFGIVCVHPECRDLLSNICHQENYLDSKDKTSLFVFVNSIPHVFNTATGSPCCKAYPSEREGDMFYNAQYPEIQKLSLNFTDVIQFPGDKRKKTNLIFDRYKSTRTTSIYILKQSFLC